MFRVMGLDKAKYFCYSVSMFRNDHTILVEMKFGSHLYGLNSPTSDLDYKGVFLPTLEEMMLGKIPKSLNFNTKQDSTEKNSASDVDRELYSLQYFFELAKKGETVALDMLHAPPSAWITASTEWQYLHANRHLFYTKTLSSFVGYARTQAAKYGIKGSRLADARQVLEVLQKFPKNKVGDILDRLPVLEHCGPETEDGRSFYKVCGKKLTLTATAGHYAPMVENFIKEFGERARQAETNQGVDWKAISHAFRAGYQVRAILTEGDFTYPLKETEFLKQVKTGALHFRDVSPILETLMDELEVLSSKSTLPEKVNEEEINRVFFKCASYIIRELKNE